MTPQPDEAEKSFAVSVAGPVALGDVGLSGAALLTGVGVEAVGGGLAIAACCSVSADCVVVDTTGSGFVGELEVVATRDAGEFGGADVTGAEITLGFGGAATGFGADVETGITPVGTTSVGVPVANVAMLVLVASATVTELAAIRSLLKYTEYLSSSTAVAHFV